MAIQLESDASQFIYHNATSSFLNVSDGNSTTINPLKEGDTLLVVFFFLDGYSVCRFFVNGDGMGRGFIMKGKTVKPTIFQDPETTVKASLVFEPPHNEQGKPIYQYSFKDTNKFYFDIFEYCKYLLEPRLS